MKVAFATKSLEKVDEHFGHAKIMAIYEVDRDGYRFVEYRKFDYIPDEEIDKINIKIDGIKDCAIVYVSAIGPTAAAKVVKNKIHPVKVAEPMNIEDVLQMLTETIRKNPPPWLRKHL